MERHTTSKGDRTPARRLRAIGIGLAMAMATTACGPIIGSSEANPGEAIRPLAATQEGETTPRSQHVSGLPIDPDFTLADDVGFTPAADAEVTTNPDGTTSIVGTVEVPTAGGVVPIVDAEVIIEEDPVTGESVIVGGTGQVPFPTVGQLADATINHLPQGILGMAAGRDLRHLGAHLVDDRQYLYFHFDGGLDVDLPFADTPGYEAVPATIEVPIGVSATMVLDPSDPYFYIGGACPTSGPDDDKRKDDKRKNDESKDDDRRSTTSTTSRSTSTTETDSTTSSTTRSELPDNPLGDGYTIDAADLPPGEDCGFGFSLEGNIPSPSVAGGDTFSGHIVIDGIVPLYTGIELDGSALVAIDLGVRTVGWGDVLATIPMIPDWLNIQIPLGDGAVDIQADGARIGLAIEGTVGGPEQITLPLDIPIQLPTDANLSFVANYGFMIGSDGSLTIDPSSRVEIAGEMGMGLGSFGDAIGLDLDDVIASQSALSLDRTGARLTGTMKAQIHPALGTDANSGMEAFLSFDDPAASFLTYGADLRIAGTELVGATIDLDRSGLFVHGLVGTDGLVFEVAGQITDAGPDLSGRIGVEIPLDGVAELADRTSAALTTAIADVERLDVDIDDMRETVRAERRQRDRAFVEARAVLETAKRDLDKIDDNIAINNRKIADRQAAHRAEKARYARLKPGQQALQWLTHSATLTALDTEIAALVTANEVQRGYRPAALATLTAAQDALSLIQAGLDALPVDTDPRVIALIGARETALLTLTAARDGADLLNIGGAIRGEIAVAIGVGGMGGTFIGQLCQSDGTGCATLAGARVEFTPRAALCVELFGLDEMCLPV